MADKKKLKKQDKEDKYKKLLEQIDLKLGNEKVDEKQKKIDELLDAQKPQQTQQKSNEVFTITSLLSKIQGNDDQENASNLKKQLEDLDKRSKLLHEPESFVKQERIERKVNYKSIQDDVTKWIPVIKRAREADHLDFTSKTSDELRVNSISGNELKRNKIAMNIEQKLQEFNLKTEKQIRAKEIELLEKVDPKEAKKRINEIQKQKMLLFQQEIKNKRVAKIKSKLYHKIKKRQKQRAQMKEYENMDEEMKLQEQEKLIEERAIERIGMKHKTKSKHIQQMLKYGDKKSYQQSLNDINHQRQALLKKINDIDGDVDSDDFDYENLEDKEARQQMIDDLQKELKDGNDQEKEELTGIKFIDDMHNSKKNSSRDEARKLLAKLQEKEGLDSDILSEDDLIESDDEEGQKKKQDKLNNKRKANKEALEKEEEFTGRKIYKKSEPEDKQTELEIEMEEMQKSKKKKKMNALDIVKTHIQDQKEVQEEQEIQEEQEKNNKTKQNKNNQNISKQDLSNESNIQSKLNEASKKASQQTVNEDKLTEGLNVSKLKQKFKKNAEAEFSKKELETFNIENKEEIYKDLSNFNVLVDDDNEDKFLAEKYEDYEKALPKENKPLQGWGSWIGQGIEQKNLPTAEELARQKAAKINLLKKQRADGSMDNVILNEKRNKLFTQHLVKELPYEYKNREQFEYLNNAPIGSEWSTMRSHMNMIKPKIKTKAGNIIQPSSAPKSFKQP